MENKLKKLEMAKNIQNFICWKFWAQAQLLISVVKAQQT